MKFSVLAYWGPTAPYARPSGSTILEADKYFDFVTEGHFVLEGHFVSEGHFVTEGHFVSEGHIFETRTKKVSC